MIARWLICILLLSIAIPPLGHGQTARRAQATRGLEKRTWTVNGVERQALLFIPPNAKSEPTPLVFGFHGHGGGMEQAALSFQLHKVWPEAMVVYMQGLNTPGRLTDPEGKKPGWQSTMGAQEDRDLHFFDAVFQDLKANYKVDEKRVFSTGHSNGGGFTYLLWATRGDLFRAMAPSSAVPRGDEITLLKPKPVLHIAGKQDTLVKFEWQEKAMLGLRKLNQSKETGETWDEHCTKYSSDSGPVVITCVYPGGHKYYAEAPRLIVKFFKESSAE